MNLPKEELEHLQYVRTKLQQAVRDASSGQEFIGKDLYEKRKYLWQELIGNDRAVHQDSFEEAAQVSEIKAGEKTLETAREHLYHLKKACDSPYFARIDFQEEGEDEEALYIGKYGFTDLSTYDQLICDWRSEIASLYYEFEPGPAHYQCKIGQIDGELHRKRQFQIEHGEMIGCFDTSVSIEDQFLQRILGAHAGENMKTIVDSIQAHQNRIIRETDSPIVVINGCAGSGKTSVALHRIAYLLYHSNRKLQASQCMIFSPNLLFEDYIASVLPDLGEDNVWQTTFSEFASEILGRQYDVRTLIDTIAHKEARLLEEKSSLDFSEKLIRACEKFEQTRTFSDAVMEDTLLSGADELAETFRHNRKSLDYIRSYRRLKNFLIDKEHKSIKDLRKKIAQRLVDLHGERFFLSKKELEARARLDGIHQLQTILHRLDEEFLPDPFQIYAQVLEETFGAEERNAFEARRQEAVILFEDATPLLYLMAQFGMIRSAENICQIIIDEAQDYTELQYQLLLKTYPRARFTILGDLHQSLANCGNFITAVEENNQQRRCKTFEMKINYRSSREIVEYTNRLAGEELCQAIDRSGGAVVETTLSPDALPSELQKFLEQRGDEELTAIVCRTAEECIQLFQQLQRDDCCLLNRETSVRNRPVCVLPVYLAKGLEFDRVAVVDDGNFAANSLYVACTRALHQLHVYHLQ